MTRQAPAPRLAVEQISARRWRLLEPLTWREWLAPNNQDTGDA